MFTINEKIKTTKNLYNEGATYGFHMRDSGIFCFSAILRSMFSIAVFRLAKSVTAWFSFFMSDTKLSLLVCTVGVPPLPRSS